MTGTVPIYMGCPSIGDHFWETGMIAVHNFDDIEATLSECTAEMYDDYRDAIAENFELAKQYYLAEDWLVEHHPKPKEGMRL